MFQCSAFPRILRFLVESYEKKEWSSLCEQLLSTADEQDRFVLHLDLGIKKKSLMFCGESDEDLKRDQTSHCRTDVSES